MKFLAVYALVAVASAGYIKPTAMSGELAEIAQIVSAIQSPSTDPATAVALQAMLVDLLGENTVSAPLNPGVPHKPSIVSGQEVVPVVASSGVSFMPAAATTPAVFNPVAAGGSVAAVEAPVVTPAASSSAALVQIILNINSKAGAPTSAESTATPIAAVSPVVPEAVSVVNTPMLAPEAVSVVAAAPEAVSVVSSPVLPEAVSVVAAPEVVSVADHIPEAIAVATPIIAAPAVNLPDILN